jgi:Zn-dependent M28 family amino/carboxypeptidase
MQNIFILVFILVLSSCSKTTKSANQTDRKIEQNYDVEVPVFSSDSAYSFVQKQVDFGPRVPNTKEHAACAEFLAEKLAQFGAEVTVQKADVRAFDGTILKAKNIIGSYNTDNETRILLFAHWDTRPWADYDANPDNHNTPILGANDGGSGVGVLLEAARQFGLKKPEVGIDIIFFDAEDYGAPDKFANQNTADSWCLGSQYWARNKHIPNYRAKYGILLDMVGASNAKFYREQISDYYAKYVVDKVWDKAAKLGFSNYFINQPGKTITDDHLYINQLAGIPSIDIIHQELHSETGFGSFWHTVNDTMDGIDKNTLNAVGTTLLHVVYNEK